MFALVFDTSEGGPTFRSQSRPNHAMQFSTYLRRCNYGIIFKELGRALLEQPDAAGLIAIWAISGDVKSSQCALNTRRLGLYE